MAVEDVKQVHSEAGLYSEHCDDLVKFAGALAGPSDAFDVVSDAIESLLKSGALWEAVNPRALMYRAVLMKARALHRSGFRRRSRERRFTESMIMAAPQVRPELLDAVVRLSVQQRACVYLGMST